MSGAPPGQQAERPAILGGLPTVGIDIPISAVLIAIYACFAATNMTIFQRNRLRGKRFVISVLLFGFCMARICTLVLRIVWATRQDNFGLTIAAQIFVNAGVLLLYIINLLLAQRILRAKLPHIGWNLIVRYSYKVAYILVGASLAMVITSVVLAAETHNLHIKQQCRDVQLVAITYLLVFTTLTLLHFVALAVLPRSANEENFGQGSMRTKMIVVGASGCLCVIIAGFKTGVLWSPPRTAANPAWYHSRAAFYVFNFVLEITALAFLTIPRIDKRFHVPNGSNGPGDYTAKAQGKSDGVKSDDESVDERKADDAKSDDGKMDDAKIDEAKIAEAKVDEAKVDEAKVDEAKVNEAKVDEANVDEAKVDEANVDEAKVDEAKPTTIDQTKVDEAKVDEAKVDEAKINEAKVDEAKVSEAKVDESKVDEARIDETAANVDETKIDHANNDDLKRKEARKNESNEVNSTPGGEEKKEENV
jgi:hypothetical protein